MDEQPVRLEPHREGSVLYRAGAVSPVFRGEEGDPVVITTQSPDQLRAELRLGLGLAIALLLAAGATVARFIAHRLSQGQSPCSPETGAYCQARKRLPETFFAAVTCLLGRALEARVDSNWLWKGRHVYLFDGTTVIMPDTPENQAAYPQVYNQKRGLGFPIARVGALTSLACGAILNLGVCRYAGKGQGEVSLLRQLWDVLQPGDVLLTDRLMANWLEYLVAPAARH